MDETVLVTLMSPSSSSETVESSSSTDVIATAARASGVIGKVVVNAGRVSVPVRANGEAVEAVVFSMQGKMLLDFSNSFSMGTLGFDASRLPQGSYMVSVRVGFEHSVQKVLVR